MKEYWNNKLVWVTGASGGIGEALCQLLAKKGSRLILSGRNKAKLEQLAATLTRSNEHYILVLDVANWESVQSTLQTHKQLLSSVDVLINNAGISQRALTWEADLSTERLIMETNYFGSTALAKAVLPAMISRNGGKIINMSSVVGKFGFPLRSSYAASKHALHGYFDSLRAELDAAHRNIHVMMVCPGRIATDISLHAVTANGAKQNEMDPGLAAGLSPAYCAKRIIRAAEQGKAELYIGKEQFLIYLKCYLPAIFRMVVSKVKPR